MRSQILGTFYMSTNKHLLKSSSSIKKELNFCSCLLCLLGPILMDPKMVVGPKQDLMASSHLQPNRIPCLTCLSPILMDPKLVGSTQDQLPSLTSTTWTCCSCHTIYLGLVPIHLVSMHLAPIHLSHSFRTCPKMGQDPKMEDHPILPSRQIQTNHIPCQTCLNCLNPSLPKWVHSSRQIQMNPCRTCHYRPRPSHRSKLEEDPSR
jgi:hypothetical protein